MVNVFVFSPGDDLALAAEYWFQDYAPEASEQLLLYPVLWYVQVLN
jgi:hypothetical protein